MRNWGLPLLSAVLGAVMLLEGLSLPLFAQYSGLGAGFVVASIGAAMLVLSVVLAVQVLRGAEFEPESAEGVDLEAPVSVSGFALAAAGVALPIISIPWLGFTLGAGLAYACITRSYGSSRLVRDVIVGVGLGAVVWYLFTRLGVELGPFLPFQGR